MKKYIFNTSWIILERVVRVALNLFIWGRIARDLGVAEFGQFSYFQALIFLLAPFCTLGIDQIIRNKISLFPQAANEFISAGIQIKFYSALAVSITCITYSIFFDLSIPNGGLIFFAFLIGLIFRSFGVIEYYFDWKLESRINGIVRSFSFLIISALYVLALMYEAPIYWFAFIFSCEFLIISCFLYMMYRLDGERIDWNIHVQLIKEILRAGLPILMCDIAVCIFLRVNQLFLGSILSSDSVGLYSAAIRFSEFWYFIPSSLLVSTFGLLTVSYSQSSSDFRKYSVLLFELMLILAAMIIVFTYLFSKKIILFFYGPAFVESSSILNVLILSNIFMFWGIVQEPIDVARNTLYWRFFRVSSGSVFSVVAGYFLISWYGAIGAAWAVVLTFFWTYFLSNLFYKKGRVIFFMQLRAFFFLNSFQFLRTRLLKKG